MISTENTKDSFVGNGVTTEFDFAFKSFSESGVRVVRLDTTTGVETELVNDVDYSLALNSEQESNPGGTVTYPVSGTALAATERLTVARGDALNQDVDFFAGMSMTTVEDKIDYLTALTQQVDEKASRSLRLGVSETAEVSPFNDPVARRGKLLAFADDASALPETGGNHRHDVHAIRGSTLSCRQ